MSVSKNRKSEKRDTQAFSKRKSINEKIWVNKKTNFHYLKRGIARTPPQTKVVIVRCNRGLETKIGSLKGTVAHGLRNVDGKYAGQMIAFSYDPDDLYLFALENDWTMDDPIFKKLEKDFTK